MRSLLLLVLLSIPAFADYYGSYSVVGGLPIGTLVSGDILYADSAGHLARLPKSADGQYLKLVSGLPAWAAGGGGGSGVDTVGTFSGSAQTNGASISSTTMTFGPSSISVPGMIGLSAQTLGAGLKTVERLDVKPLDSVVDAISMHAVSATGVTYQTAYNSTGTRNFSVAYDFTAAAENIEFSSDNGVFFVCARGTGICTFTNAVTGSLTGNASTATALAANPTDCASNTYATTIAANGNLTCASITNASTTATASAGNSTIVARDGSGNFAAGTITAALTGNASTATALAANPADCASNTYATTIAASGDLTCASITNASTTAASANTASAIVARDGSGNFSAGTITAALTGNATTATALAVDPTACTSGQFVSDIAANGTLTCGTPAGGGITIGTTAITSGTSTRVLFENASHVVSESSQWLYDNSDTTSPAWTMGDTTTSTLSIETMKSSSAGRIIRRHYLGTHYWDFPDDSSSLGKISIGYDGDTAFSCLSQATPYCQFRGTTTNDDPTAGYIGEQSNTSRLASAATSVTSATALNITASALSLTKGDWDVTGTVCYIAAAGTSVTSFAAAVSKTSATLPASDTTGVPTAGEYINQHDMSANVLAGTECLPIPTVRVSLTATTSIYLVGKATFSVSTLTGYGSIVARRIR